jgi:hypothetical protein
VVVFLEDPAMRNTRPQFNFTLTQAFPVPLPAKTQIKVRQELRLHRPTTRAAQESVRIPEYSLGLIVKIQGNDTASYRGIFLSNAMLKLFEGILESLLQVFTEKFDTLTPSQQGSRPGRQRHDAIYSLLAAIQQQKQSPQKSMQGATPSRGASYCEFVDLTTAYPSVPREKLQMILKESGITGKMWELLK